jgi:hypothetical protein
MVVGVTALTLAACASEDGATTSPSSEPPATTVAPTTTIAAAASTTTGAATGFGDIPEECQELIREVLLLLEPAASEIDWSNATIEQHIMLMNALAGASIESTAGCEEVPDITAEEGAAQVLEFARAEAPGTVAYLEHVISIPPLEEEIEVTGECQADLATLEKIIADGVPMVELPLNKAMVALDLIGTINFCPLQVAGEFTFREETQAFIAGLEHLAGG